MVPWCIRVEYRKAGAERVEGDEGASRRAARDLEGWRRAAKRVGRSAPPKSPAARRDSVVNHTLWRTFLAGCCPCLPYSDFALSFSQPQYRRGNCRKPDRSLARRPLRSSRDSECTGQHSIPLLLLSLHPAQAELPSDLLTVGGHRGSRLGRDGILRPPEGGGRLVVSPELETAVRE